MSSKKKVCIVGGGPSGLVTLRRVLDSPELTGTIFEQKDDVGGLWNYKGQKSFATSPKNLSTEHTKDEDPEGITTMYDDLTCNLPFVLLEFMDFKHPKDSKTFPTQPKMHEYLRGYATHFNMWSNIEVNTAVVSIRPEDPLAKDGEFGKWMVETHNLKENIYKTDIFDGVVICTGKNSYPYIPKIPGIDDFKGRVMHTKYYKNSDEFRGQNVVCLGLGPSAADLALHLSKAAKQVTVCHKFPYGMKLGIVPHNVREVQSVKLVTSDGVITDDNERISCDAIILCTGYGLKFPFLSPECGIEVVEDKYVPHLHNMTLFTKQPSLAILNMCYRSPEIVLVEIQARYFVSCLEGKTKLPSFQEMEAILNAAEEEKRKQGQAYSIWFQVGDFGAGAWEYFLRIAEELGLREQYKHCPLLKHTYETLVFRLFGKLALYKNDVLKIIDDSSWEYILSCSKDHPETKTEKIAMHLNEDGSFTTEKTDL